MSLDVSLKLEGAISVGSGINIRDGGSTKEISREEWDRKFPGREPMIAPQISEDYVWEGNITHNLTKMADECNLYWPLWRPEEMNPPIKTASDLIPHLNMGLRDLLGSPEYYQQFNPENGWGTYEGFVEFVKDYLEACNTYPEAKVEVWR